MIRLEYKMCISLCGRFVPKLTGVAGYVGQFWANRRKVGRADCRNEFSNTL